MIKIRLSTLFPHTTVKELEREKIPFIVTRNNNKIIIISLKTKKNVFEYILEDKKDKPLYMQALDMQIGKLPSKIDNSRLYRVQKTLYNEAQLYEHYEEI